MFIFGFFKISWKSRALTAMTVTLHPCHSGFRTVPDTQQTTRDYEVSELLQHLPPGETGICGRVLAGELVWEPAVHCWYSGCTWASLSSPEQGAAGSCPPAGASEGVHTRTFYSGNIQHSLAVISTSPSSLASFWVTICLSFLIHSIGEIKACTRTHKHAWLPSVSTLAGFRYIVIVLTPNGFS